MRGSGSPFIRRILLLVTLIDNRFFFTPFPNSSNIYTKNNWIAANSFEVICEPETFWQITIGQIIHKNEEEKKPQ